MSVFYYALIVILKKILLLQQFTTYDEDYQKGIDMIFKQFQDILTKLGVESFGEKGDTFDPNLHSAVMHTEEEGEPENAISEVFSKGYKLGDKILRPAVVKVVN